MGLFQRRNHLLTYLKLRVFFPPNFAAKLWRTWRSAQRACLGAKILLHHLHSHLSLPSLTTQTTIYKLSKILRRGNKSSSSGSLHSPPCLPSYPLLSSPPTFYPQSRLLFLPCWHNLHHCPIQPHRRHFSYGIFSEHWDLRLMFPHCWMLVSLIRCCFASICIFFCCACTCSGSPWVRQRQSC